MEILTKYHGEIEVNKDDIWYFPKGIPGFPDEDQFILYPLTNQDVFSILQSVKNSEVAFIVTNPFAFFPKYDFVLDENSIAILELESSDDAIPFVILTLGESLKTSSANLQAPLVLNVKNKRCKQVILHDTSYHTKHLLLSQVVEG